jgi:site-specific DNA-methyltransferase (adenine-specific)
MHAGRETNVVEREVLELSNEAKQWEGWGTALKPAHEPMVLARKPLEGTVANNVLTWGVGGLNIDGSRVGSEMMQKTASTGEVVSENREMSGPNYGRIPDGEVQGRFPANFIHDGSDEVLALFPDASGSKPHLYKNASGMGIHDTEKGTFGKGEVFGGYGDSGSAARFFYCAKASKRDRNEGLNGFEEQQVFGDKGGTYQGLSNSKYPDKNHHPTVKPTDLMRYLCKLVTPPKGIVLDLFMGSGSTGKGAVLEGFEFIGIEQSAEYCEIAKARIEHTQNNQPEFAEQFLL